MSTPCIVLGPDYSLERVGLRQALVELPASSNFLLIYFLSSNLEQFPAGSLLLLNPHTSQTLGNKRGRAELLLIRLAPQLLLETATRLQLSGAAAQLLFRTPLQPLKDALLQTTLAALAEELHNAADGWREMIAAGVKQLTVHLLRRHINVQRSAEIELSRVGLVDRRLRRALEFMHDNCGRELTLSEIAAAAYLSEFHFARLFKKLTGATPHAYLASVRLERARRLLVETDLALSEIGARVGYVSQSHFTKVFRAATGLTPKAFRNAAAPGFQAE
jgi:AraC family transcriptional regulator